VETGPDLAELMEDPKVREKALDLTDAIAEAIEGRVEEEGVPRPGTAKTPWEAPCEPGEGRANKATQALV
jgi:hypothetical protein